MDFKIKLKLFINFLLASKAAPMHWNAYHLLPLHNWSLFSVVGTIILVTDQLLLSCRSSSHCSQVVSFVSTELSHSIWILIVK